MSGRIFCKFFGNGACLKGEHCQFSHDWNDSPGPYRETVFNNICTFYQKGVCSYGTRCKYAHTKIQPAPSPTTSDSVQDAGLSGVPSNVECRSALSRATELSDLSKVFLPPSTSAGTQSNDTCSNLDRIGRHPTPISLAERPICSFAIYGNCPHGVCSYGTRCKYAHTKIQPAPSPTTSDSVQDAGLSGVPSNVECRSALRRATELSDPSKVFLPPSTSAGTQSNDTCSNLDRIGRHPTLISLAERPICSFAIYGNCPHGENCPKIHGDLCFTCSKYCLHPYRPVEREEHIKFCEKNYKKQREILKQSEEIECSVCFDRVLSKATPSEQMFGLLSECDHPFCLSCIRNWRSNSPSSGMDVNTVLRACPVCRKRSYFVIPSDIWYSTKEEKQEIINSYKARLRSIDCKHFNFGRGKCPFGTSCFYKHSYSALGRNPRTDYPVQDFSDEELENMMFQQFGGEAVPLFGGEAVPLALALENMMFQQFGGEAVPLALADFTGQTGDELEDSDDELEIAYMIMQMDLGGSDSSTDDTKFQ